MKAKSPMEDISENSLNPSGLVSSPLAGFIKDFHVKGEVCHSCIVFSEQVTPPDLIFEIWGSALTL